MVTIIRTSMKSSDDLLMRVAALEQEMYQMKIQNKIIVEQLISVRGTLNVMIERLEDNDGFLDH